jgi:MYXO-CTERM domain-containing protein
MRTASPNFRPLLLLAALASVAVLAVATERRAEACGGCLAPADVATAVDSHRMIIALGSERTILWDQIVYSGDPDDFVWVLPVPSPDVEIDIASSTFIDELDFLTAPRVSPEPRPVQPCFGCCSAGAGDAPVDDEVIVYNSEVVGPYETVTIGSEDPGALADYLTENGYAIDPSIEPILGKYADAGNAFVVLRLAPDQGVQHMEPVRISYPGFMGSFPLEMVTVGARGVLDLSLWVIAEQRYEASNYANVTVSPDDVVFSWADQTSNYADAFAATIEAAGGRAWVTEFAGGIDRSFLTDPSELDLAAQVVGSALIATRMRTRTRVENLNADITLAPAADPTLVSRDITAGAEIDRPFADADDEGCSAAMKSTGDAALILIALLGLAVWRRRRRSTRS